MRLIVTVSVACFTACTHTVMFQYTNLNVLYGVLELYFSSVMLELCFSRELSNILCTTAHNTHIHLYLHAHISCT